jgi:cytochrome c oxidase cbb3-type subunit 3/ubiquinol-cytochrome c reductase cytochrome c subunit
MRKVCALGAVFISASVAECTKHEQTQVQHGGDLYGRMCAVCHGSVGEGYKADNATALSHPDFLASVSDDFLRKTILDGRSGTVMSAWGKDRGGPLQDSDVDAIIAYIRTWQTRPQATLDESPPSGDATRGAQIFAQQCERCHGKTGTQGPNVRIGNVDFLQSARNGFLRYAIRNGRLGTPMPSFELTLGPAGIEDVIALLRSWQTPATAQLAHHELPPAPAPAAPLALGPVPLNPGGPEPVGFHAHPAGKTGVDVVKRELDRGAKMAILDARAPTDYALEHIAGAVSVPFYDPDPYVPKLPKDAWLVCYCSCPSAESGQLCQKLFDKGFKKVTVLEEGLGVWKARKYPTHTGAQP